MRVHDDRVGNEHELAALLLPPLAELAVLAAGQREGLVEASCGKECLASKGHVPRPEEAPGRAVAVARVQEVEEPLRRLRVAIRLQQVPDGAAGDRVGPLHERGDEQAQPVGLGHAVVVRERDEAPRRRRDARVPRRGRTAPGAAQRANAEARRERLDRLVERHRGAVVDDHRLDAAVERLCDETLEAAHDPRGLAVGRDHDRDRRIRPLASVSRSLHAARRLSAAGADTGCCSHG